MKRGYGKGHRDWRSKVLAKFDNKCVICGEDHMLNAHHLIPWEVEEHRTDINNGIALCPKHHTKYGHGLSPHSHGSALFFIWMMRHRPDILKWVEEHFYEV